MRQLPNNLTIVPNAQLTSAVTANVSLPDPEQAVMREVEGGVPGFTPFIRYHTFADSSIQFTVTLRGRDYVSQYLIKHELIKRLHERYRMEGIEIPFPIRTVQLRPPIESAGLDPSGALQASRT